MFYGFLRLLTIGWRNNQSERIANTETKYLWIFDTLHATVDRRDGSVHSAVIVCVWIDVVNVERGGGGQRRTSRTGGSSSRRCGDGAARNRRRVVVVLG